MKFIDLREVFLQTGSTLRQTTINPIVAKALAAEISSYVEDWYDSNFYLLSKPSKKILKNRDSQDFLFEKLMDICLSLSVQVSQERTDNAFFIDTGILLYHLQEYATKSLHKIKLSTLVKVLSKYFQIEDGKDIKTYLQTEVNVLDINELKLKGSIKGNNVILTPMSEDLPNDMDDSAYLEEVVRSEKFLTHEDFKRLSRIIKEIELADKKGESINDKDFNALAIIGMNYLIDIISHVVDPTKKALVQHLLEIESVESVVNTEFLQNLGTYYNLQRKKHQI